jgi:CheY-like chemotaxis protein
MTETMKSLLVLVEDDPGHALLVEMNIRSVLPNIDILKAEDGQIALDMVYKIIAQQSDIQLLILLDLNLPTVDGYQVLQTLKSKQETRAIPVFILSSTDDTREIERCYALGCNGYLQKSIEYPTFAASIQRLAQLISIMQLPRAS